MSNSLFDMSQYQTATTRSYSPDWRDATESEPAWDVPDLEPNLETRTDGPNGNAFTGWQIESEFSINLESGQTVKVKFIPCLEGGRRMHQFDFTGPVSPTGFKSHFVLAVEAEEYPHPRDYAQAYVQDLVARFEAAQQQKAKSKKRTHLVAEMETPQEPTADNDNFRQEPAIADNETTDSTHAKVEVVEELSSEEEVDRQRLELKVERGIEQVERTFYQIGKALAELRKRRLYRSTHKNFSSYCQERFRQRTRRKAEYLIVASVIMDELKSANNCSHFPLPTAESQIRCLRSLNPEQRQEVWHTGVTESDCKVPTAKTIKGIVERLKQRDTTPPPIPFQEGDVVLIRGLRNEWH